MKFSTGQCVKEVLCDIAPTNICHLLLRWAWIHFKMLNLDERSLYLRHEGHEMKLRFMTPRQAKDWWRKSSYHQAFIRIKQGSNSVQKMCERSIM